MDIRSNQPFWLQKNGLVKSYPSLQENITTDVLIVGGGITGALMAYRLLNEGKKVCVIDKRDVGSGSTAASTAMLQYEIDVPLHKLIEQRGLTPAVSSYKEGVKAIKVLKNIVLDIESHCGFEYKKSVYFCNSKDDVSFLEEEFAARQEHGFNVKWLDKEKLEELGLEAYADIESKTAAVMDSYKFASDLWKYCSKKEVKIYDKTELKEIEYHEDKIIVHTANGFSIEANDLVHCTGYESVENLSEDIVKLKSTYALASEELKEIPRAFKNRIYWNTDAPYLYFRMSKDGRIIMGGEDDNFKNAKLRDALLPKKEKKLVKKFKECFPNINIIVDYAWAGTFGETKDSLPYFGKPDPNKNEHFILGFGGNGITFSVMGMEALVNSINNSPHPFLEYYKFDR